jgi:uncharacterized protein
MKLKLSHIVMAAITVAIGFLLIGCAAKPPTRFHSLLAIESSTRALPATPGFAVTLATVSVPPQVDQPQWLVRNADGSLSLLEQERWVAPLRGELQGALLDRWAQSWGGRPVVAGSKEATWRVSVDVTRWEAVPGREVRLESRWSAASSGSGGSGALILTCRAVISEAVRTEDGSLMLALAASHRRVVSRLADEVASRITAIQKGEAPRCTEVAV